MDWDGVLKKRPSLIPVPDETGNTVAKKCVRSWIYRPSTTDVSWIIGSFYNSATDVYELYYQEVGDNWTQISERRDCNHSVYPHQGVAHKGRFYVKSFPNEAAGDRLGSVVLDASSGSMEIHDWGFLGPTTPAAVSSPAGWSASDNPVTVRQSWIYSYTWVNTHGHESSRAPLQTNPDETPSAVGPFTDKVPEVTVTAPADDTEYPFVNIYRTTDGGGTFYFLEQIANTGTSIVYEDASLESGVGGGTFNDPLPDTALNTLLIAPSETANDPPPTTIPPNVTGTDEILNCTRVVEYSGRLWYGIGDYLFFSANEELTVGVPAEAWPSGLVKANFYRLNEQLITLVSTADALLVVTLRNTYRITGSTKDTFNLVPFLPGVGGLNRNFNNNAAVEAGEFSAWVTQDLKIVVVSGESYSFITHPLGQEIRDYLTASVTGGQVSLHHYNDVTNSLLILSVDGTDDTPAPVGRWWLYDFTLARRQRDDFWYTPWAMPFGAITVGPSLTTFTSDVLYQVAWDGTTSRLGRLEFGTITGDVNPTTGDPVVYGGNFTTSLLSVPEGNHVNANISSVLTPEISAVGLTRTKTAGDSEPTVSVYLDDFFTTEIPLNSQEPWRREQSIGYEDLLYGDALERVATLASIKVVFPEEAYPAEIHRLAWEWLPGGGS